MFAMTHIEQNSHVHENPQFHMQTHILILQLLYFIRDHGIFQWDVYNLSKKCIHKGLLTSSDICTHNHEIPKLPSMHYQP